MEERFVALAAVAPSTSTFKSMVTAQRTLELMRPSDVSVLLSVDGDLCAEVALFLALRFNAWIARTAKSTPTQVEVDRRVVGVPKTWEFDDGSPNDLWMTAAARFLLARGITPGRASESGANECPYWLTALRDVPTLDLANFVPVQRGDAVYEWIARVVLGLDVAEGRCCAEYHSNGMPRLKFVHCHKQAFYNAVEREHRDCMTVQVRCVDSLGPVDLRLAPNVTRLWLPLGCEIAKDCLHSLDHVVSIDLSSCTNITTVDTSIADCPSLTSITLPASVTAIGCHFAGGTGAPFSPLDLSTCTGLHSIGSYFGSSMRSTSVKLPASVTEIGAWFCKNAALTVLDLSSCTALCSIKAGIGVNCKGLTSVTLPTSVIEIGPSFSKNTVIQSLDLSTCTVLRSIGHCFAERCARLTLVKLPASVTTIGDDFCSDAVALTVIDLSLCAALASVGDDFCLGCATSAVVALPAGLDIQRLQIGAKRSVASPEAPAPTGRFVFGVKHC